MSTQQTGEATTDRKERWTYGLYALLAGVAAILLALVVILTQFDSAADVGSVLGLVVSPIATMVAAYFGVQAGSAGKAAADENAKKANEIAVNLAAAANKEDAQEVLRFLR